MGEGANDHRVHVHVRVPKRMNHVSADLVNEILLRLQVKPLLRFKTVCKTWYNLINSSHFIKNHHHHHANRVRLLVYKSSYDSQGEEIDFAFFSDDEILAGNPPSHDNLKWPRHDIPKRAFASALGPVNGFFLLRNGAFVSCPYRRLNLVNPATRESKILFMPIPNPPPPFVGFTSCIFGLGFVNNAFKVVSLWAWVRSDGSFCYSMAAVYTSDTDSWKHFHPNTLPSGLHERISTFNGVTHANYGSCYWLLSDYSVSDNKFSYSLLSFDMSSELFREIKIEGPQISNPTPKSAHLLLHNGYIAMFLISIFIDEDDKSSEIWVMNEKECWTKYLTLDLRENWTLLATEVLQATWNNHQLILLVTRAWNCYDLVIYDVNSGEIRELGIRKPPLCKALIQVFKYRESLASPKNK